uniref:Uncharacterized protein n=1 Tax=Biomphalaria glabrata TaxID=6526 RepID=A0A2C9LXU9_BIOGL
MRKMKETIFLVLSILVCKVYSDGGVSFYVGSYTIQFNETMLQSLLKCLCETTFGCDVYFKYSHNLLTPYRVIKYSSSFNNGSFYDAYVCNEPMTVTLPSFSCTKVIVNSPILPITSEDSCITLKYENYTGCFSNGMALFWSYNPFEMNITSPSIKKNNNCEEVVTVSTSTMSSTLLTQATSTSQSLPESSYFLTTTSNPSLANVVSTTGSETLLTTAAYSASATTPDTSAGTLAPPNIDTATQLTALQTNAQMETMSSSLAFASLDPNSISASMLSLFTLTTEPVLSDTSEPLHSSMFQSLTVSLLTTTELTTAALHISSLTSAPDFSFASTSGQPMTTDAAATNSVPLDASMSVVIDVVSVSSVLGVSNAIGVSSTSGLVTSATVEATSGLSTGTIQPSLTANNTNTIPDVTKTITLTQTDALSNTYMLTTETSLFSAGTSISAGTNTSLDSVTGLTVFNTLTDAFSNMYSTRESSTDSNIIFYTASLTDSESTQLTVGITVTQPTDSVLGSNSIAPSISVTGSAVTQPTDSVLGSNSTAPSISVTGSANTQSTDSVLGSDSIATSISVTGSAVTQPAHSVVGSNTIAPSISVSSANTQASDSALASNSIEPASSTIDSVSIQATVNISDTLAQSMTRTLSMVNVDTSNLQSTLNTKPTASNKPSDLTLDSAQIAPVNQTESSSLTDTKTVSFVAMTTSVVSPTHLTSITEQLNTPSLSTGSWPTISGMISGSAVVTMTVSLSDIAPTLSSSYTSLGFVSLSSAPGTKTLDTLTQSGSTRTDTLSNSAITSTGTIDASATASLDTSLLITPSMTDLTYTGVVASTINPSPSQPTTSDSNYGSGGHSSGVTLHPTASSSLSTSSPPPANVTIPPPGLNSRQEDDRDKIIAITVGVIGGALFIFAIIIAIFCWRRRQKDRSYETMDAQSTSSDQRSDTSEEIPSKTPDAVNFDGIIPRFPNYKDYNGWDTFRPPYFTMIDIGPTAHNIIKGSVVSPGDATLTKKSSFKKKSSMKSVQFVNPLVEEIEPDYDATVSISSNGQPKKGIIVKTVKFKNTVSESNDFEDVPREDTDKEQSYEYPHQTSSDYDYATVSFSSENRDSHGTYDTLGTVSDSPSKTSGPPLTSFQSNTPNGHMPNNTVEESTHF